MEQRRAPILARYERILEDLGSPLVRDAATRRQVMAQGNRIITDVAESLRIGRVHVDANYRLQALDIGTARAASGVHPRESLRAASVLFEAAIEAAMPGLDDSEQPLPLFRLLVLALNTSIHLRIGDAASAYSGYLINRIHEAHLEERRRIARELHDRIGHGISHAFRQLELYDLYRTTEPVRASSRAVDAQNAIEETMRNLRDVTAELRLQEPLRSLEKALLTYIEGARVKDGEDREDTAIRLNVNGDETWAPPAIRDESFLVLREAVRNALRHSRPGMVLISVDIAPHELRGAVEDDGSGFDPEEASGGVGLASMRERAALMGGGVTVTSRLTGGTTVELVVPLPGHRDEPA
jgi:signal transduction histidine kinase